MYKKLILTAALAATMGLAGCTNTQSEEVSEVRSIAEQAASDAAAAKSTAEAANSAAADAKRMAANAQNTANSAAQAAAAAQACCNANTEKLERMFRKSMAK